MEWSLTEEQQVYSSTFQDWLGSVAPTSMVRTWLEGGDLTTFTNRFVSDGWLGVGFSEDRGGEGGGLVELALTAEALAGAAAPSSAWLASALTVEALGEVPPTTVAWLSSAERPPEVPRALRMDAKGRLSGRVQRVLAGAEASSFVVACRTAAGTELRILDTGADGVDIRPRQLLDRSRGLADITLNETPSHRLDVDADAMLGRVAGVAAVLVAADALGAMQRMLTLAVEHSLVRQQFGVAIGSFQAVKHAAADVEVCVEAARSGVYFAAASVEAGLPDSSLHAAAIKSQVTTDGARSADLALTMHGAIGFTWEHDLHLFYRRACLDTWLAGDPTWWNERIADGLQLSVPVGAPTT